MDEISYWGTSGKAPGRVFGSFQFNIFPPVYTEELKTNMYTICFITKSLNQKYVQGWWSQGFKVCIKLYIQRATHPQQAYSNLNQ
jgi:hypothetical protein